MTDPARRADLPIDVCSHRRSGTHLTLASLWLNFRLPDVSVTTIMPPGRRFVGVDQIIRHPGERAWIPWGRLWASHEMFGYGRDPRRTLYVVRNPVATLMSNWRFLDPRMRHDPEAFVGRPGVSAWFRHASGYRRAGCEIVRYEDLVGPAFFGEMERLGERFGLEPRNEQFERVRTRVGWFPDDEPRQPKEPPAMLIDAVAEIVPAGFLGYND